MGKEIEHEAAELRRTVPANVPVRIVGMDRNFIASEAAFYHFGPRQDRPGNSRRTPVRGNRSLMYAYWFPPAAQDGAALLLVSFERGGLERSTIHEHAPATRKNPSPLVDGTRTENPSLLHAAGAELSQYPVALI